MKQALCAILLSGLISDLSAEGGGYGANPSTYIRFTIADPEFGDERNDQIFDKIIFDYDKNMIHYDHISLKLENCEDSFYCLSTLLITVAVPKECSQIASDGSWSYKKRRFRVVEQIKSNSEKLKYVIEGFGEGGMRENVIIYSTARGIESFAIVDSTGKYPVLINYHLTSELGALAGGCVRKLRSTE